MANPRIDEGAPPIAPPPLDASQPQVPKPVPPRTDPDAVPQSLSVLSPINQYYQGSRLNVPSLSTSIFTRGGIGFMKPFVGISAALGQIKPDEAQAWQLMKDVVDLDNSSPLQSPLQRGAGEAADFTGSILNPISLLTAEAGGAIVAGGSRLLPSIVPKALTKIGETPVSKILGENAERYIPKIAEGDTKRIATLADIGARKMKAFGIGAGVSLPTELESNFDTKNNTINYRGAVAGTAQGGGIAVGLDTIPYLWGVFRGKFKAATGQAIEEVAPAALDETLDHLQKSGALTEAEVNWYKEYRANPHEPSEDFVSRSSKMLLDDGHNVDTARGKVMHDILTPSDMKNLNIGVSDQIAASLANDGNAFTDFVWGSKLDEMRANPTSLDGIEGVLSSLNEKLAAQPGALAAIDSFVEKYGTRNWRRLRPFSQENLYKKMVEKGLTSEEMPVVVPEAVSKRIAMEKRIESLEAANKNYETQKAAATNIPVQKRYAKYIERNEKKIADLHVKKPEILSPKDELKSLHDSMVKDGKLVDNFKHTRDYHRLVDLAKVETGARSMLYRINSIAQYEKQAAYRDMLQFFSNVMQTNFDKLADSKKILDYMKNRIEDKLPKEIKDQVRLEDVQKAVKDVPDDYEKVLDDTRDALRENAPKELAAEYEEAAAKVKEFTKSENIFKNLISCVMGSLNG